MQKQGLLMLASVYLAEILRTATMGMLTSLYIVLEMEHFSKYA